MDHFWVHPSVLTGPGRAEYGVCDDEGNAKCYYQNDAEPRHDSDMANNCKEAQIEGKKCHFNRRTADSNENRVGKRILARC